MRYGATPTYTFTSTGKVVVPFPFTGTIDKLTVKLGPKEM
jgi:hypothetical protein